MYGSATGWSRMMLTRTEQRHLERAARIASTSTCRQRHGAVAAIGARIIAVGVNSFRCHPTVASDPKRESSFHAEIAVLRQLREVDSRTTLFVARVAKNGRTALSAPCANCRQALKEAGVKQVIFSVDGDGYGVVKL